MLSFGLPSHTTARRLPALRRRVAPAPVALRAPRALNRACACGGTCPHCSGDFNSATPQTKLAVNEPGDAFEREAGPRRRSGDADAGPAAPAEQSAVAPTSSSVPSLRRASCLQRDAPALVQRLYRLQGGGRREAAEARRQSSRPGHRAADRARGPALARPVARCGDARLHGAALRRRLRRRARAQRQPGADQPRRRRPRLHGRRNIAFGGGEYRPDAEGGRRLLA
jgi:hypothetical protein